MNALDTPLEARFGNKLTRWFARSGELHKWAALAMVLLASAAADARIIYVNFANTTPGNGTSWATSYKYLRDGLDASVAGDLIYLAEGIYYPDEGSSGQFGNRELSFDLDGVKIYGGFVGTETSLAQRNPLANPTVLSGGIWDLPGEDVYWSLHVVELFESSTLDGVTVEKGNAQGRASWNFPGIDEYDQGGGCYVNAGKILTLQNCIFTNNRALSFGGAIMVADDSGGVVATDCLFDRNYIPLYNVTTSVPAGGAIKGRVTATNCQFISNTVAASPFVGSTSSSAVGGAIAGNVNATDCDFLGNTTTATGQDSVAEGGAIAGNVVAINCTFSANASDAVIAYGGAIRAGSLQAVNCVFSANSSTRGKVATDGTVTGGGGAVHISSGSSSVVNSIFLKNTSGVSGGAIHSGTTSNADLLTVTDSTFLDNGVATPFNGAAIGCGGIVRIMNNIFWNTVATAGAFDQNNLIYVINKGVLRNTDAHYPTPSIVGQNVVKRGILGVTKGSGGDLSLGNPADTLPAGDPLFVSTVDPDGADNLWRTADDGLRLTTGSSAIGITRDPRITAFRDFLPKDIYDIDDDGIVTEPLPADIASFERVQGTYLDMGAYEFGSLFHGPDISVEYPAATILVDGAVTAVDLSALAGVPTTFVIKNLGTSALNKLAITGDGVDIGSFKVTQPTLTTVASGGSATFVVTFIPTATGARNATIHIVSNDLDENPFDIKLTGNSQLPDIAVETPVNTGLVDGTSVVDFGAIGEKATLTKTFTLRNSGLGNLGIFGITSSGTNAANFTVTAAGSTLLLPGATTTFNVTFKPSGIGSRSASIVINNSDPDSESSFLIKLSGSGVGAPEIVASEPFGSELVTGTKSDFGSVGVTLLHSKTFVVKNTGSATLKNLAVTLSGSSKFTKTNIGVTSLAPGAQAKFSVTFKPTAVGKVTATLVIASNDANESQIVLNLSGTGVSKSSAAASSSLTAASASLTDSRLGTVVTVTRAADGLKYLVLTVDKAVTPKLAGRSVEVSSNLTKWFSGSKHTTTLLNNQSVLRVRDNTPVKQGEKRYIRFK